MKALPAHFDEPIPALEKATHAFLAEGVVLHRNTPRASANSYARAIRFSPGPGRPDRRLERPRMAGGPPAIGVRPAHLAPANRVVAAAGRSGP